MKRTVLTLALGVLLVGFGYSQKTEQGTIMAGGSIGLTINTEKFNNGTSTSTQGKNTLIEFNPTIGYFIVKGFAVGAGINISTQSYKDDGSADKFVINTLAVTPLARYYTDMGLFGHAAVRLGSGKSKNTNDIGGGNTIQTETKFGLFGYEIGVGYAYFLNDNVAIEPLLLYANSVTKNKTAAPNTKNIHGGLQLRIGFNIFL